MRLGKRPANFDNYADAAAKSNTCSGVRDRIAWGLTPPVHGPTLIPWTTGRGSDEQAFISRSFSSSLLHVRR
jgi:hypothetical protein